MEIRLKGEFGKLEDYVYDRNGAYRYSLSPPFIPKKRTLTYDELPSPTIDNIFKIMFCTKKTKKHACKLFGLILDIENIQDFEKNIVLVRNELDKVWLDGSTSKVDFLGEYEGVYFNLEMNEKNTLDRNAGYAYKISLANEKEDKEQRENLNQEGKDIYSYVVQMNINDFTIEGIDKTIDINVTTSGEFMRTKIIFIDIYLPLINKKYIEEGIESLSNSERTILGMFIGKYKEATKLGKEDEEMLKFIEKLRGLKKEPEVMEQYFNSDREEAVYERALETGRDEGLEQGRQKANEETALNMLKKGLDINTIHECTNLPMNKIQSMMTML